jgi:hypothetical protein
VAADKAGNTAKSAVTFEVTTSIKSLAASVNRFYAEHKITKAGIRISLLAKLAVASAAERKLPRVAVLTLQAFIYEVNAQKGKAITPAAAVVLVADARAVIASLR